MYVKQKKKTHMSLIMESFPGLRRLTVSCTQETPCVITPSFLSFYTKENPLSIKKKEFFNGENQ